MLGLEPVIKLTWLMEETLILPPEHLPAFLARREPLPVCKDRLHVDFARRVSDPV
jgi:hypothetical protein